MGLPQEVIDYITVILQDDRRDLEACSLTCKTMFALTRHSTHHWTLYVTWENDQKTLTLAEKMRYLRGDTLGLDLCFLSFMDERDLLKYARRLNIRAEPGFSPYSLEPQLQHFRSLDRIHTLTIHSYDARHGVLATMRTSRNSTLPWRRLRSTSTPVSIT